MGDFYIYNTLSDDILDTSDRYENTSHMNHTGYSLDEFSSKYYFIFTLQWLIVCIGLPLTLMAIFAVYTLIKADHTAPVYVINLLISDLIQLCCLAVLNTNKLFYYKYCFYLTYIFAVMASVGFMVCISLERYLVIAWPVWYRFKRNIKTSVVVCCVVWTLPLVYVLPVCLLVEFQVAATIFAVFLLVPLPLFIFFLVGTLRALSGAQSVPAEEKRRIVMILVVVLLIYTVLFLPTIIWFLIAKCKHIEFLNVMSFLLVNFSPLADVTMYIFIRKGDTDKLLVSLRCCKRVSSQKDISLNS